MALIRIHRFDFVYTFGWDFFFFFAFGMGLPERNGILVWILGIIQRKVILYHFI